jgi:hypothetical protein
VSKEVRILFNQKEFPGTHRADYGMFLYTYNQAKKAIKLLSDLYKSEHYKVESSLDDRTFYYRIYCDNISIIFEISISVDINGSIVPLIRAKINPIKMNDKSLLNFQKQVYERIKTILKRVDNEIEKIIIYEVDLM